VIREACLRELRRGGQVYFVHNSVDTIENTGRVLGELVPEARIAIGHGQMRERDLEQVMLDFYHKRANLLLCTTIIESGIDVPTANTIIIDRADRFGLAQLHQMRGRVGRSHHQATLHGHAAAQRHDLRRGKAAGGTGVARRLGAGFVLATHDLEIRGAGELLGENQSGQIHEIGFALYTELLERAVEALARGKTPELERPLHHGPEIDLHVRRCCPSSSCRTCTRGSSSTSASPASSWRPTSTTCRPRRWTASGRCPSRANLFRSHGCGRRRAPRIERLDVGATGGSVTFRTARPSTRAR